MTSEQINAPTLAPAPAPEPEKPTADEVLESLTGYDELAIEKAFGSDVESIMSSGKGLVYLRALVFAQELHGGAKHDEAKKTALTLTVKDLNGRFRDDTDGDDPDLPGSESGKDGA
jgi:hypothetical protein